MMRLIRLGEPLGQPVTIAEAKDLLNLRHSDKDALLQMLVDAAIASIDGADGWLNRALCQQQYDMKLSGFGSCIRIPLPPLVSVDSITYLDTANASQTLATSQYRVVGIGDRWPGRVDPGYGIAWPPTYSVDEAVTVRFTCGYPPDAGSPTDYAANVPKPIKLALLQMVNDAFENRGTVAFTVTSTIPMSLAVERLLSPFRVWTFP